MHEQEPPREPGEPAEERPREAIRGRRPGDRHIRVIRSTELRPPASPTYLVAEPSAAKSSFGRAYRRVHRVLIGAPIPTAHEIHERLTKVKALAVLSSDAISSTAYATEETLLILVLAGSVAFQYVIPIGIAIIALLAIVASSYRQTIRAYPQGGGSYIVTKDNLGTGPSLLAASSLLIDYTLTVAVSISSGVAAITSAFDSLAPYRVELAVGAIVFITLANLRGVRESGSIFAVPTYLFIVGMFAVILLGLAAAWFHLFTPHPVTHSIPPATKALTIFLVLRAFSSGCTALTGVEAISDGVPAFQPPEARNARRTLTAMALVLGSLFLGITILTYHFHLVPSANETILSQLTRTVVGRSPFYYYVQATTAGILLLAANTSFSDFPRLSFFLARDGFLPHQFRLRGDRLAYSTGILALGIASSILVIGFGASVNALIPLYAVGVFLAFTLSQASMTYRWWKREPKGHQRNSGMLINGLGALTTGVVAVIIITTKFLTGAWIVLLLLPILIATMLAIHRHYQRVAAQLVLPPQEHRGAANWPRESAAIVPIDALNEASMRAIEYAERIASDVVVVHVALDTKEAEQLAEQWRRERMELPLVVIESPYREIVGPLVNYIEELHRQTKGLTITVVLPEFVPAHLWELLLHNQTALRLKFALWTHPDVVVINVPYLLTV